MNQKPIRKRWIHWMKIQGFLICQTPMKVPFQATIRIGYHHLISKWAESREWIRRIRRICISYRQDRPFITLNPNRLTRNKTAKCLTQAHTTLLTLSVIQKNFMVNLIRRSNFLLLLKELQIMGRLVKGELVSKKQLWRSLSLNTLHKPCLNSNKKAY